MGADSTRRVLAITTYDRTLPPRKLPTDDADVWICRWSNIPYLRVAWHTSSRLNVLRHCYENPNIEVGGVLLGGVYRSPVVGGADDLPIDFVEIVDSIRAEQTNATIGQLEFTSESWARINRERDEKHANLQIVGWYHTHPGHDVFLSNQDRFIHNNFFAQDFQLALVVDTHAHYGAFFVDSRDRGGPYQSEQFRWHHELMLLINRMHRPPVDGRRSAQPAESETAGQASTLSAPEISISLEELEPAYPDQRGFQGAQMPFGRTAAEIPRTGQAHGMPLPSPSLEQGGSGRQSRQRGLTGLQNNPVRLLTAIGLAVLIFILLFLVAFALFESLLPGKYSPTALALLLAGLVAVVTFLLVSLG